MEVFNIKQDFLINEQIRFAEVQVINEYGEKLGKLNTNKAIEIAYDKGLDLVLVSPNKDNPVCKMLDYSKYKFEMAKKAKEAKKNQKVIEIKEIRLSPNIDKHDIEDKAKTKDFSILIIEVKYDKTGSNCCRRTWQPFWRPHKAYAKRFH